MTETRLRALRRCAAARARQHQALVEQASRTGLSLLMAGHPYPYRVEDLSAHGVRIRVRPGEQQARFARGKEHSGALLWLEEAGVVIQLESLVPRYHGLRGVGLTLGVHPASRDAFDRLLATGPTAFPPLAPACG